MSYFLIINPGSKHNRGAKFIPELFAELNKRKIDFEYRLTKSLEDAYHFSKKANENGAEVIVAIGGDGTINKVTNGFFDDIGKRISNAKLGVIHTGTSPDFCKSYGIPTKSSLALETLLKGHTKEISVARVEFHTKNGQSKIGYFTCCASFGLGSQVARNSNLGIRKYLGDTMGTFFSILISLCGYKPSALKMFCDGKEELIEQNFNTFIGKTTFVASGMKVSHQLLHDDKRLYILSLKMINLRNIVPALRAIYSGKAISNQDYLSFSYARTIEILRGHTNNEIEFDGDPQGFLPCRISIAKDNLELITNEL